MQLAIGVPHGVQRGTDTVIGGNISRDGHDGQTVGHQWTKVLIEIVLTAAHRDHGRPRLSDHAGDGGADAAARRAGHHDHAPSKAQQILTHLIVRTR